VADLLAFLEGRFAGTITATWPGTAEFRYADTYLRDPRSTPLSLSAPLGRGAYEVERWLDGLLPDNVAVRRRWAARNEAPSARPVDLLGTPVGLDCLRPSATPPTACPRRTAHPETRSRCTAQRRPCPTRYSRDSNRWNGRVRPH